MESLSSDVVRLKPDTTYDRRPHSDTTYGHRPHSYVVSAFRRTHVVSAFRRTYVASAFRRTRNAVVFLLVLASPGLAQQPERARTEALARRASDRLQALQCEAERLASEEETLLGDLRKLEIDRQI